MAEIIGPLVFLTEHDFSTSQMNGHFAFFASKVQARNTVLQSFVPVQQCFYIQPLYYKPLWSYSAQVMSLACMCIVSLLFSVPDNFAGSFRCESPRIFSSLPFILLGRLPMFSGF